MLIEIETPLIVVKYSTVGETIENQTHIFEVWEVPEDPQALYDKAKVASNLKQSFDGEYMPARKRCQDFLDRDYPLVPTLWIEREAEIFAVSRE